jgi:hypothetical protein
VHLIQILLSLRDDEGRFFPAANFDRLAQMLTEKFGGVTSFTRSPAEGRWKQEGSTTHDDIVVIEVMTDELDREWWSGLRERLRREFHQDDVLIRSQSVRRL